VRERAGILGWTRDAKTKTLFLLEKTPDPLFFPIVERKGKRKVRCPVFFLLVLRRSVEVPDPP
jgi:hypothetical protein